MADGDVEMAEISASSSSTSVTKDKKRFEVKKVKNKLQWNIVTYAEN